MTTVTRYHTIDESVAYAGGTGFWGTTTDPDGAGALSGGTTLWIRDGANSDRTINDRNISGGPGTAINDVGWLCSATSAAGGAYTDLTAYNFGSVIPIGSVVNSIKPTFRVFRSRNTTVDTWYAGLFTSTQVTPGAWATSTINTAFSWQNVTPTTLTAANSGITAWSSAGAIDLDDMFEDTFGVRLTVRTTDSTTPDCRIDALSLVVDYTEPASPTSTGPIYKFENIRSAFSDIFSRRVHIIGAGDSNWAFGGYGHRKAIAKALVTAGFPCAGTGPVPMSAIGYVGYNSYGYSSGGYIGVSDPDTFRNELDNYWGHAFTIEGCDVSAGATPTITKTGAFADLTLGSSGQVYLDNMGGSPATTAGIYTFTTSTADSITLASSPTGGSAKTGNTRVTELLPNVTTNVRGNLRNVSQFGYAYVNDAGTVASGTQSQLVTTSVCPFDNRRPLTYTVYYGTFASGTGSFTLQGRSPNEGYAALTGGQTINPVTGTTSFTAATWNLPANSLRTEIEIGVTRSGGGSGITGPFFGTHSKLELTGVRNGYDFATFYQQGGESAFDMATALQTVSDSQLATYLQITRDVEGVVDTDNTHTWIIMLESAGNDRNETEQSVGAYSLFSGSSRNAYEDNTLAFYTRLRDKILATYPNDRVVYLMVVTHPHYTAGVEDSQIAEYRKAAYHIADTRTDTAVINFGDPFFGTPSQWASRYDAGGTDTAHLDTDAVYDEIWTPLMNWIMGQVQDVRRESVQVRSMSRMSRLRGM